MSAVAQAVGHGERVVVDAAPMITRHDDDLFRLRVRQIPPALSQSELEPLRDVRPRERLDPAPPLLDEVFTEGLVADDALQLRRDGLRRLGLEEDAAVAERLRDRRGSVRDDGQVAPHRLEERYAEAFVLRESQERRRAAVVRDELLDGDAAGERDRIFESEPPDVAADPVEVAPGHRRRTDEVEAGGPIGLAVFRERGHDVVDGLVRKDLAHRQDRGPLVRELAGNLRVRRPIEILPVHKRRNDRGVREPSGLELLAVVLAVRDAELRGLRELFQLLEAVVPDGVAVRDDRIELMCETERVGHSPSTLRVRSATFSGSKSWTRFSPAATSASRSSVRSPTIAAASAVSGRSRSCRRMPAAPTVSPIAAALYATTGNRKRIASRSGTPKPSCSDSETNAVAAR